MRAAIYARVSTSYQAEDEIPILGQIDECQQYAEAKGWEVVEIYKDEGFTGQNANRPDFQRLLADAKSHRFDTVVTWKSNRIARNVAAYYIFKDALRQQGIDFIAIKEPEVPGPVNAILEPLMAGISEFFSLNLAQDTLRGLKQLAKDGYATGGRPPRGYLPVREVIGLKRNGQPRFRVKWEVDPQWRGRVVRAFELLVDGRSAEEIIKQTQIVKNKSSLCTLFRNPTYIGERVFNVHRRVKGKVVKFRYDDPEIIRIPESHEALIPIELFNQAQKMLEKRRPLPGQVRAMRHDFILSGVLWCETHNCAITGYGNKRYRYYACEARRRRNDKCILLRKEPLEEFVIEILKDKVYSKDHIREALEELRGSARNEKRTINQQTSNIKQRIRKLEEEINNFYKAIADGIPAKSVAKPIEERQHEKESLEKELGDTVSPSTNKLAVLRIDDELIDSIYHEHIRMMESEEPQIRRNYIQSCIERIKIEGGSITISFKIKEPPSCSRLKVAGVGLLHLATIKERLPEKVISCLYVLSTSYTRL